MNIFKVIRKTYGFFYLFTRHESKWLSGQCKSSYHFKSISPPRINLKESNKEFNALYPIICNDLKEYYTDDFSTAFKRFQYAMQYNMLNRDFRTCFPVINAYDLLIPDQQNAQENRKLAYILDWCVELLVTACFLNDDIMDHSKYRWEKQCWYLLPTIGKSATYDAKILELCVYFLLKKYFSASPYYKLMLELFKKTYFITALGQSYDINMSLEFQKHRKLHNLSLKAYNLQYRYKAYYFISRLSVYAGIYLTGQNYSEYYKLIDNLLEKISDLQQMQNDVWDCFGQMLKHEVFGSDICHGKPTWLIATAQTLANDHQMELLKEHYGKYNLHSYHTVKNIYTDLDLLGFYKKLKKQEIDKLYNEIDQIPDDSLKLLISQCIDVHDDKDKYYVTLD